MTPEEPQGLGAPARTKLNTIYGVKIVEMSEDLSSNSEENRLSDDSGEEHVPSDQG